jgi:imidazolonepropionase-like amidohydrolase
VKEMHDAGVGILAGTDTGSPFSIPGFSLHQELQALVDAGLSNIEALRAATLNPAKFLGREKDFGAVEKGKIADLVLLDANPLENISNTKKINAVIVNGKLLKRTDLDAMLQQVKQLAAK